MKRILAGMFVCSVVAGCGERTKPTIDEHDLKRVAKNEVVRMLKDPDSAKFDYNVMVTKVDSLGTKDRYAVCGKVNAKNSFGGYTGEKRFIVPMYVTDQTDLTINDPIIETSNSEKFDLLHRTLCRY